VAFGTLVQLMAEGRPDEAARVAAFNRAVGLPTCLAELGVGQKGQPPDEAKLALLVERSLVPGSISWNLGPHLTPQLVRDAILAADTLGSRL
jgi:glycerol dehydrogenase-like iron-containing ADH family enzyme